MEDGPPSNVENTVAQDDPGDETANRYRFQWTWAAIACCMLLDDTQDVEEVFCEHHEDVLLKHADGTFTGQQVKTRGDDQPPWKAGDETVRAACARFVRLDTQFPGQFRRFSFLSNHSLYAASNAQDLKSVLSTIAESATIDDLPRNVTTWLRRVARMAACSEAVAFAALSKTQASGDLPKLRDATIRLVNTLANCWPAAADSSFEVLQRAALSLVEECGRASSLDHLQLLPTYLPAVTDAVEAEVSARIDGKRMSLSRVLMVLDSGRHATAPLVGDPNEWVEPGEGSTELLLKKLDAGGFSAVSRNSAEDLRDKADYLGIKWTKQHGRKKGLERYNHIRTLVLSETARAFEETRTTNHDFGPPMREALRRRFEECRARGDQLYDCAVEHLEGVAFSLTAQCQVHWSIDRPWEAG